MKWLKKLFGIKTYVACPTCKMVYEPDGTMFDDWCPEHRKPHIEAYHLRWWAINWTEKCPEKAKKIRDDEINEDNERRAKQNQTMYEDMARCQSAQRNCGIK